MVLSVFIRFQCRKTVEITQRTGGPPHVHHSSCYSNAKKSMNVILAAPALASIPPGIWLGIRWGLCLTDAGTYMFADNSHTQAYCQIVPDHVKRPYFQPLIKPVSQQIKRVNNTMCTETLILTITAAPPRHCMSLRVAKMNNETLNNFDSNLPTSQYVRMVHDERQTFKWGKYTNHGVTLKPQL